MKRLALCLLLCGCATPEPSDKLDLPHEGWPVAARQEIQQLRYELARLKIEHELLQDMFRNTPPPF